MRKSIDCRDSPDAAALAVSSPARSRARRRRPAARQRPFRDLVQRGRAAPLRPRHALPAFVLVHRRQGDFRGALKADPTCAMAYWGIALTLLDNPHNAIPAPNLAPGLAAIQKAKAIGAKTERERDYIDALTLMYADYDKTHPRAAHAAPTSRRMEALAAKYPDDDEAQIAYAITLNTSASPDRQDLCPAAQGRGDPGADLQAPAAASRRRALPDPPLRLSGDRRRRASTPPTATPRSRRPRRTPSTCRRTSSPASATGRNRSRPTSPR